MTKGTLPSVVVSQKLAGIQLTRFVAALLVVVTHATFYISSRIAPDFALWNNGAQGVNIFFVVSGFVMMLSAQPLLGQPGSVRRFVTARLIRIVPLYWALNLVKVAQILAVPSLAFANPTVSNVIFSMLFLPSRNADGVIETFYGVGWTLNFEMFFYGLVALALWWRRPIFAMVAPVLIAATILSFYRTDVWPAVTYLSHPVVLNFLWGMVIAMLYARGQTLPFSAAIGAILAGVAVIVFLPDTFLLEIPYALLVAGVVALEPWLKNRVPQLLIFGGDASYSLYLVHPMAGVLITIMLGRLGVTSIMIAIPVIVGGCLTVAAITFVLLERPMTRALQRRFAQPSSRARA